MQREIIIAAASAARNNVIETLTKFEEISESTCRCFKHGQDKIWKPMLFRDEPRLAIWSMLDIESGVDKLLSENLPKEEFKQAVAKMFKDASVRFSTAFKKSYCKLINFMTDGVCCPDDINLYDTLANADNLKKYDDPKIDAQFEEYCLLRGIDRRGIFMTEFLNIEDRL